MDTKITLECNVYNANRTNTGRAHKDDGHYDFSLLAEISGAKYNELLKSLQYCAENHDDESAIESVRRFSEALLSAYEIQADSYK